MIATLVHATSSHRLCNQAKTVAKYNLACASSESSAKINAKCKLDISIVTTGTSGPNFEVREKRKQEFTNKEADALHIRSNAKKSIRFKPFIRRQMLKIAMVRRLLQLAFDIL